MAEQILKKIKIQTGVLKRAAKEWQMYDKELETEKKRLETMRQTGKDEYELRHQDKVIAESAMMLPESRNRLIEAHSVLKNLIQEAGQSLAGEEDFKNASLLLTQVRVEEL